MTSKQPPQVKSLLTDPAFWITLLPILAAALPGQAEWFTHHKLAFAPLETYIVGHFGVRTVLAWGAAK